ncbi:hypothetical protein PUN28_009620 [Cardiocondyla obscurior]|uniref:Uncharacterized protein n=1 Tax=Cardiocondyla obscurior TaxID=286306 RepID=A0AAW2FY72_9HYME
MHKDSTATENILRTFDTPACKCLKRTAITNAVGNIVDYSLREEYERREEHISVARNNFDICDFSASKDKIRYANVHQCLPQLLQIYTRTFFQNCVKCRDKFRYASVRSFERTAVIFEKKNNKIDRITKFCTGENIGSLMAQWTAISLLNFFYEQFKP